MIAVVMIGMPHLSLQMEDVKIDFRAEQYEQMLSLKDSIATLANWQTFFPYRPKTTPLQDPKAWWRYVQSTEWRRTSPLPSPFLDC